MKKLLIAAGIIFFMAQPVMAEGDLKIGGNIEIQYILSGDKYGDKAATATSKAGSKQGEDALKFEEIYIKLEKEVSPNVSAMIKLDGADMNEQSAHDHSMIEEAQIIFKNLLDQPLTIYVGKDEMPWIQDYESFLFSSEVHGQEVDKVMGIHGSYKIKGFGSIDLAFFERDTDNKPKTKYNTGLTDSMTVKVKLSKLVKNLSLSLGYAKEGKDKGVESDDATGLSVAAKYTIMGFTIYGEMLQLKAHDGTSEKDVKQLGVDYKVGDLRFKVRHEIVDDDKGAGDDNLVSAIGVSYYLSKKSYLVLEHESDNQDGMDAVAATMAGFVTKF